MLAIRIVCLWVRGWWGIVQRAHARVVLRAEDVAGLEGVGVLAVLLFSVGR